MGQVSDSAEKYRAVCSRDARFDGQFVSAISSTGIYCRPSCPARTPKRENITFFSTSAAAHEAGYRACKRCLPEASAGSPQWNLHQDLASRAMRLIRHGVMREGGVEALSARLGYSSRHIHRTVAAQLGAGPLALDRAQRAQSARSLLTSTDASVSDVAFASGFSSIRQFNETIREVFDVTPSQIRARRSRPARSSAELADTGGRLTLQLQLPVRQPFDAVGVFSFLAQRAVAGVETAELGENRLVFARTLRLSAGPGAMALTAIRESSVWRLGLRCEVASLADAPAVVAAARRLLDLDADPVAVDTALAQDEALAPLVTDSPGIRLPGTVDGSEYLIRAVVGQQISVAAARTHLSRLAAASGTEYDSRIPGLSRLFPTPEQILTAVPAPGPPGQPMDPDRPLRLPARSISTVRRAAAALASGELDPHPGADPDALAPQLTSLEGIGEWTSSYLILRALGHPDQWMRGDVALLAGAATIGLLDPELRRSQAHTALASLARRWSPWRSYAALHLWNAAAAKPKGHRT